MLASKCGAKIVKLISFYAMQEYKRSCKELSKFVLNLKQNVPEP